MTISRRFRDLPIRRKLLVTSLTSNVIALAFIGLGFLLWDAREFLNLVRTELTTQANLVAESAASAVEFQQETTALRALEPLRTSRNITHACLYLEQPGTLLTGLSAGCSETLPAVQPNWYECEMSVNACAQLHEVVSRGDLVGYLYMRRDLRDLYGRVRVVGGIVLGLFVLAIAAAFLLSARLQRAIAEPLLNLAETARRISSTRDYSLRPIPTSRDEVGVVVHAVNDMLDQIGERTAELSKANAELENEVEVRRRAEEERTAALERERDANRLKDEFLATLSHELRTPLNAVLGWTRVLQTARVDPPTQARALDSIERNARTQARLIEDLLEVSRIVTGKLRLQMKVADLSAIIEAAVEVVQPAAAAKRIALMSQIDVRPALTAGDPDRLQQIVWNLLSNAVKFTPQDGSVLVTLARDDGYTIRVTDTGPGIEQKFIPHVFEPFRQADGSASREHGGLGLGLAIAKRLVELHGGTIHASRADATPGATFEVHLPSVLDPATAYGGSDGLDATGALNKTLLRDVRVLVVDDEEDARLLLEAALSNYGADVTTASSADEALSSIDRDPPDVLLSDIGMPQQDGFSLIRHLRSRPAAKGGTIPAIAITAYASQRDRSRAEASGFQAHIAKPFEPSEVARTIAQLRQAKTA